MHQPIDLNSIDKYTALLGQDIECHDDLGEYQGKILFASPSMILVLLDNAMTPVPVCPRTYREITMRGNPVKVNPLIITAAPPSARIH